MLTVIGCLLTALTQQGPQASTPVGLVDAPPAGSTLWLEADSGTEQSISMLVERWLDRSRAGVQLEQVDGAKQPYLAGLALNGHTALRFDGNDLVESSTGSPDGSYTKVVIVQLDSAGAGGHLVSSETGHGLRIGPGGFAELTEADVPFAISTVPLLPSQPAVLIATYSAVTNIGDLYLNGTLVGSGNAISGNADPSVRVGSLASGGAFSGWIAEILVYDRALGPHARRRTLDYLEHKYLSGPAHPEVEFSALARDGQVLQRLADDTADLRIEGTVETTGFEALEVEVLRDGQPFAASSEALIYDGTCGGLPCAPFAQVLPVDTGLVNYTVNVYLVAGAERTLVAARFNVVCGDVYLIQGQSNAAARDSHAESLGSQNESPWIRAFGSGTLTGAVAYDLHWGVADGLRRNSHASVGAWGTRMGFNLVNAYQVPIALLNGAVGTTSITQHERDDADPENIGTIYGRLLFRAREAGVADGVRALFWYQGEADPVPMAEYANVFSGLSKAWRADFTALQLIYVFQVREGCSDKGPGVREFQRQSAAQFTIVRTMSTTAAPGHDGCHFFYAGYEEIGDRITRLVTRDFYGSTDTDSITSPNLAGAKYSGSTHDRMLLTFQNQDDVLVWEPGAEIDFVFDDPNVLVVSGTALGHTILLQLNGPSTSKTISYIGHALDRPVIRNTRGVGAFTFFDVIID
ncbi:MAG: hypothetical protein ACI8QZ_000559 [Chlamydiales bacterium]|jgi:hypothetical protein